MDLPSGTWKHVYPADAETDVLKQYLKRHNQVIPPSRPEILRLVTGHLSRSGRQTLIVKTRDGPMTSVISKLGQIFSRNQKQPTYDQPPQIFPTPRTENLTHNIRGQHLSISPITPLNSLHPTKLNNYETDSLNSRSNSRDFTFPPPPQVNSQAAGRAPFGTPAHSFFSEDSVYEDQRDREPIYATPTPLNIFSQPHAQKVTFDNDRKISTPEDKLSEQIRPPALSNISNLNQMSVTPKKLNTKFQFKFKSCDSDISDYLSAVERYAANLNLSETEYIFVALQNFSEASEQNLCAESLSPAERSSWELFKKALYAKYGKTVDDYWHLFENTYRKDESPQTYLSQLSIYYKKANDISVLSDSHKSEITRRFKKGINPSLKAHLDALNANDFDTIANLSRRLERAHSIPKQFSARLVNQVQFPSLSVGDRTAGDQTPKNSEVKSGFKKSENFNSKSRDSQCGVCSKTGHSPANCWFNPLGRRYRGSAWVETEIAKMSKN